jgi:hypothetical protein
MCPKREEWVYLSNKSYEITSQKTSWKYHLATSAVYLTVSSKKKKSTMFKLVPCSLISSERFPTTFVLNTVPTSFSHLINSVQGDRWYRWSKHMLHNLLQQSGSHRFLGKQTQKKNCYFLHRDCCHFYTKPTNNKPSPDLFGMFVIKCSKNAPISCTVCVCVCLPVCVQLTAQEPPNTLHKIWYWGVSLKFVNIF